MIDEGLLPIANTRYILMENPADQVQLPPPPPSSEFESAMMWRPADVSGKEMERIPLAGDENRDVAAVMGAWLGASLIHTMIADARKERDDRSLSEPSEDDLQPNPKKKQTN